METENTMAVQARDFKFDFNWAFRILRRFWPIILATTVIGAAGSIIYLKLVKPKYSSSLKFLAWNETVAKAVRQIQQDGELMLEEELERAAGESESDEESPDTGEMSKSILAYSDLINRSMAVGLALINDYQQLIEDSRIADEVKKRLEADGFHGLYQVRSMTTPRSSILTINVIADDPRLAQTAAEMTMEVFRREQQRLMGVQFAQKISDATLATAPFSPNRPRVLLFGIFIGALLGCAIGALLDYLDYSVKTPDDLAQLGLLPLGNVPEVHDIEEILTEKDWRGKHRNHLLEENLALLKVNLHHRNIDNPQRTILITSDMPGCGKSTTSILLAQTLASVEGSKVLLIDCDLRRPSLFTKLKQNNNAGLVDCLLEYSPDMNLGKFIAPSIWENVDLMTHGQLPQRPSDFFESRQFVGLLELLKQRYRYVVLDAPPVFGVADPLLISQLVDAVILVAVCGKTRVDNLQHLLNTWPEFAAKILGAVLNRYNPNISRYGYYGHGYYGGYYGGGYYGHGYYGYYGREHSDGKEKKKKSRPEKKAAPAEES